MSVLRILLLTKHDISYLWLKAHAGHAPACFWAGAGMLQPDSVLGRAMLRLGSRLGRAILRSPAEHAPAYFWAGAGRAPMIRDWRPAPAAVYPAAPTPSDGKKLFCCFHDHFGDPS